MPRCGQSAKNTARNRPRNRTRRETGQARRPVPLNQATGWGWGWAFFAARLSLYFFSNRSMRPALPSSAHKASRTESGARLGLGLGLLGGAAFLVLLLKSFDASRGVHQLLLACVEGMAVGADFHADVALVRGAGLECVATSADDVELVVSGMNTGLHL